MEQSDLLRHLGTALQRLRIPDLLRGAVRAIVVYMKDTDARAPVEQHGEFDVIPCSPDVLTLR